jgi:hypothetical protein
MRREIPMENKLKYAVSYLGCWNIWFKTCIKELGVVKANEIEKKVESQWGTYTVESMRKILGVPAGNDALAFKEHMSTFYEINGVGCASWIEATPKKTVYRMTDCPYYLDFPAEVKENEIVRKAGCCGPACYTDHEHRVKAINPKLELRMTKSIHQGDPYCEYSIELKD